MTRLVWCADSSDGDDGRWGGEGRGLVSSAFLHGGDDVVAGVGQGSKQHAWSGLDAGVCEGE